MSGPGSDSPKKPFSPGSLQKPLAILAINKKEEEERREREAEQRRQSEAAAQQQVQARLEAAKKDHEAAQQQLQEAKAVHAAQVQATESRADEALSAARDANARSAELELALAEAMRVREHEESHGAFQSSLADATHNRLRAQIEQMEREVEEGAKVAAGHEALAHAEKARADLFGEAIRRIHDFDSVSSLFD